MANQGGTRDQHSRAGEQSHKNDKERGGSQQQAQDNNRGQQGGGERRGGQGNFANDREKASEAGRKGGRS